MAKIYGFTPIELRDGVKGEDFEKFWLEVYAAFGQRVGWTSHLLKADRGERAGKYAVIWELPSVESRARIVILDTDAITEEGLRLLGPDWNRANAELDALIVGWPFTDYIELGKV